MSPSGTFYDSEDLIGQIKDWSVKIHQINSNTFTRKVIMKDDLILKKSNLN